MASADGRRRQLYFFPGRTKLYIHAIKPDVCRAWPFFRGNMADAESLHLAKAFCPGIRPDATHEEFVEEGQSYLEENGLVASDPEHEGHALLPVSKTDSSF